MNAIRGIQTRNEGTDPVGRQEEVFGTEKFPTLSLPRDRTIDDPEKDRIFRGLKERLRAKLEEYKGRLPGELKPLSERNAPFNRPEFFTTWYKAIILSILLKETTLSTHELYTYMRDVYKHELGEDRLVNDDEFMAAAEAIQEYLTHPERYVEGGTRETEAKPRIEGGTGLHLFKK